MDFIILKVNGTDVSSFPHEDAVRAFLTAQEPIVVEVKRRLTESPQEKLSNTKLISTGCQTDLSGLTWIEDSTLDCLTHDIDLEEVTLRKCSSAEKLGLTVCYSSGSEADTCTEVYIRDIAPQSVADRDGRLRQGDQILQVNGKDVANKEETESLFAENSKAVTLLVSRCYTRSEEYLDVEPIDAVSPGGRNGPAYQNSFIEQLIQQQNETHHSSRSNEVAPKVPQHFIQDKLNLTNSLVRSKMDSINNEISELDHRMQNIQLVKIDKRKPPQLPNIPAPIESDTEHIYETIPETADSETEPIYSCPYDAEETNIIEEWLKAQQQDFNATNKDTNKDNKKQKSKSSKSNSSGEEHENSSSAYNTGGSCNSNPLTFELACSQDAKHKDQYRSTLVLCQFNEKEDTAKEKEIIETCETCKQQTKKKTKCSSKNNSPSSPPNRLGCGLNAHILSDTMYTNVANLQQTMLLQQQLFRQALIQGNIDGNMSKPTTSFTSPSLSQYQFVSGTQTHTTQPESGATLETRMEWKVKRRPDGTRYIARRPVRNRILKNRAIKISEERAGLTTEDDTISELKIGRYWTKEERKRHLEKSRERKQRQEILLASKNLEENNEIIIHKTVDKIHSCSSKKAANNLDNTVKKHKTKRTHKDTYDNNFPTVQEMIVHGPKIPNSNSKMVGLLSVTTV